MRLATLYHSLSIWGSMVITSWTGQYTIADDDKGKVFTIWHLATNVEAADEQKKLW
jgi:hypothetical protein